MNYKKIIAKAIEEFNTQKTPYFSYFKSKSQMVNRNEYVDIDEFILGCNNAISVYKKHIEDQYNEELNENNWVLSSFKQMILNGETVDQNGKSIQEKIDCIENEQESIRSKGYKTNNDNGCFITETGEITTTLSESKYELNYSDLQNLENAILDLEPKPVNKKLKNKKTEKDFISFLHHPNINALNTKLHELLDNSKGKIVAITIKALIKNSFLGGYKSNEELFKAMRKEFGEIGTSPGLNSFLNENGKKLNESDIVSYYEILKRVK